MARRRDRRTPDRWLFDMAAMLRPWFKESGLPSITDNIQFRCGHVRSLKHLGVTHHPSRHKPEDPISVVISMYDDDSMFVTETLIHELVHCLMPPGVRHGKPFKDACAMLGIKGDAFASAGGIFTSGEQGQAFRAHVENLLTIIGPYPHKALPRPRPSIRGPSDRVRLRCPDKDCGFRMTISIGPVSLMVGLPYVACACGEELEWPEEVE
jgi:hypothetical protein